MIKKISEFRNKLTSIKTYISFQKKIDTLQENEWKNTSKYLKETLKTQAQKEREIIEENLTHILDLLGDIESNFKVFHTKNKKVKILAKFFTKQRHHDDPDFDYLLILDKNWDKIYNQNKFKYSFSEAELLANEFIVSKILTDE